MPASKVKRLVINRKPGSFSDRWIAYCDRQNVPYEAVDCLDSDIMRRLDSADALLWHWHLHNPAEQIAARHVIMAAEAMGLLVFPNTATCWHYDDKVAQKYLLEAVGAPLIPTHIFYELEGALRWIEKAHYPKVFKLRKGAGSQNVRLVRDLSEARSLTRQALGAGFQPISAHKQDLLKRFRDARRRGDVWGALRRLPANLARVQRRNRTMGQEAGYLYLQDFIPGNAYDIRVTIIGNRAFGFTRNVRKGDFRASGSGDIVYDIRRIPMECVRIAFDVANRVGAQSMAFDFLLDEQKQPVIAEVSYCYDANAVHACTGHWDADLKWHEGAMWPEEAILIDLLDRLRTGGSVPSSAGVDV